MSPAQVRLALIGALVTHHHPVHPRNVAAQRTPEGLRWRYRCPLCRAARYGAREDLDAAIADIRICSRRRDPLHAADRRG